MVLFKKCLFPPGNQHLQNCMLNRFVWKEIPFPVKNLSKYHECPSLSSQFSAVRFFFPTGGKSPNFHSEVKMETPDGGLRSITTIVDIWREKIVPSFASGYLFTNKRGFSEGSIEPGSTMSNFKRGQAVRRLFKRFPMDVGCSLKVSVTGETSVDVAVGQNAEEIIVEAEWFHSEAKAENTERFLHITATHDTVEVNENEHNSDGNQLEPDVIKVSIPERWCNVIVHTWEGAVSVSNVTEANLEVKTDGGDVKLGKVKGEGAEIDTRGGSLLANTIYSALRATTHGGNASFQQVLGNDVLISTGGGDLHLESMYGENLKVVDCGSLQMSSLNSKAAEITVGDGGVVIEGLDGNLQIQSGGGNVQLQLNENARMVEVNAGEGNVVVFLPSSLTAKVEYTGEGVFSHNLPTSLTTSGGKTLNEKSDILTTVCEEGKPKKYLSTIFEANPSWSQRKIGAVDETISGRDGNIGKEERICSLKVRTNKGSLTVKRRGWIESMIEKTRKPT